MSARAPWRSGVPLAALLVWSACDFVRPSDPLEAHPDVVTVSILLVAGETEARLLAVHPHRDTNDDPPAITATLQGPGWTAEFSKELELESCTRSANWPGPTRCLGATLPEALRPRQDYEITGTAPLGSFEGRATIPAAPDLLEPGDSLRLPPPQLFTGVDIAMRYRAGSDIGTLLADVRDAFETQDDGTELGVNRHHLGYFPQPVDSAGADTVYVFYQDKPLRFSLHVLGIGWHYTNFVEHTGTFPVPQPWPSFGIEGEGVYGYFDGLTASRGMQVRILGGGGQ